MQSQDEIHLETISKALWEGPETGRAAVMIGSGFSRNAEATGIGAVTFPLWHELSHAIVGHLYVDRCSEDFLQASAQAQSVSGALRLADEFVAAHGRARLDDLIIQTIRDGDFRPSAIHRRMLELPWRDVFTTNYDTLLERAAQDVVGRNYEVVTTIEEIPTARTPRIIKLHGSMPGRRPFILSEEDFRTYPRRFAPFVNLTQQSMMENIFCLFGFSGDDPNFLAWSGWVRDELGKHAPRLYLCGVLDLSDAKRRMLHDRNVTPIDLAPQFSKQEFPDIAIRHMEATKYLVKYFEDRRPLSPLRWQYQQRPPAAKEIREPMPANLDSLRKPTLYLGHGFLRETYPGWIVAPASVRESVNSWPLSEYFDHAAQSADLPSLTRLEALDNLVWWIELGLQPLWEPIAKEVARVLEEVNPFSKTADDFQARDSSEQVTFAIKMKARWLSLSLSYLRNLRELSRWSDFESWVTRLDGALSASSPHRQNLIYERALAAVARADDEQVDLILKSWVPNDSDPIWAIRKAGLLTEMGHLAAAEQILSASLNSIRRATKGRRDIANLSREGWCMALLSVVRDALGDTQADEDSRFGERWEELNEYKCNPWLDWNQFGELLNLPSPAQPVNEPVLTWSVFDFKKYLPAYQAVRLVEEVGFPSFAHNRIGSADLLRKSAEWHRFHDPTRLRSILWRTRDTFLLKKYLTRYRIASLTEDESTSWLHECLRVLVTSGSKILSVEPAFNDPIAYRAQLRLGFALSALSSLALCIQPAQAREAFDKVVIFWNSEVTRRSPSLHMEVCRCLAEFVQRMSGEDFKCGLMKLLELPLAPMGRNEFWDDITAYLPMNLRLEPSSLVKKRLGPIIRNALEQMAGSDQPDDKSRALQRLFWLYRVGLLSVHQKGQFAKQLWSSVGANEVPRIPRRPAEACLWCPEVTQGKAVEHLKRHILSRPLQTANQFEASDENFKTLWAATAEFPNQRTDSGCNRIEWEMNEVAQIHSRIMKWWNDEGNCSFFERMRPFGNQPIEARVTNILSTLIRVLIPNTDRNSQAASEIAQIISEIETHGFPIEIVLPALLQFTPSKKSEVTARLSRGLLSTNERTIKSTLDGIFFWLHECADKRRNRSYYRLPMPPTKLLDDLAILAAHRRQPGLLMTLSAISSAIFSFPNVITKDFIASTTTALDYLIHETRFNTSDSGTTFAAVDRHRYRFWAAKVAVCLHDHPSGRSPITLEWVREIANDPLPEVRECLTRRWDAVAGEFDPRS